MFSRASLVSNQDEISLLYNGWWNVWFSFLGPQRRAGMMIRVMFRLFAENWPGKYQNHIRKAESQTIVFFFLSLFLVFQYPLYKICKVRKIPQCACSHIVGVKRWAQRRQGQNFRFAVPFFRFCLSTRLTCDFFITFNKVTFIWHRTNFRLVENSCI